MICFCALNIFNNLNFNKLKMRFIVCVGMRIVDFFLQTSVQNIARCLKKCKLSAVFCSKIIKVCIF